MTSVLWTSAAFTNVDVTVSRTLVMKPVSTIKVSLRMSSEVRKWVETHVYNTS